MSSIASVRISVYFLYRHPECNLSSRSLLLRMPGVPPLSIMHVKFEHAKPLARCLLCLQVARLRGAAACQAGALVRGNQPVAEALATGVSSLQLLMPLGCPAARCGAPLPDRVNHVRPWQRCARQGLRSEVLC